jgi:hypothetical protein
VSVARSFEAGYELASDREGLPTGIEVMPPNKPAKKPWWKRC